MLKKLLLCSLLPFMFNSNVVGNSPKTPLKQTKMKISDQELINFTLSFVRNVASKNNFTLKDDKYFLGGVDMLQAILLMQLGYMDEAGRWIKPQPKKSLFGLILKKHRKIFELENKKRLEFAVFRKDKRRAKVIIIEEKNINMGWSHMRKEFKQNVFIISIRISEGNCFINICDSTINNIPLAYLLGYRIKKEKSKNYKGKEISMDVLYYPKDKLEKIIGDK